MTVQDAYVMVYYTEMLVNYKVLYGFPSYIFVMVSHYPYIFQCNTLKLQLNVIAIFCIVSVTYSHLKLTFGPVHNYSQDKESIFS